mmetsp:Transcript_15753/g.13779  ORF Transcript_15753/g.13779 Transcript_15753/m.13779 type:complete len:147 (+) Transcript_15753:14-454(+)
MERISKTHSKSYSKSYSKSHSKSLSKPHIRRTEKHISKIDRSKTTPFLTRIFYTNQKEDDLDTETLFSFYNSNEKYNSISLTYIAEDYQKSTENNTKYCDVYCWSDTSMTELKEIISDKLKEIGEEFEGFKKVKVWVTYRYIMSLS